MAGVFFARLPKDIEQKVSNMAIDKYNSMTADQKAVLDAEYDDYKKSCEIDDAVLPYYVWIIVCWELYVKEDAHDS